MQLHPVSVGVAPYPLIGLDYDYVLSVMPPMRTDQTSHPPPPNPATHPLPSVPGPLFPRADI